MTKVLPVNIITFQIMGRDFITGLEECSIYEDMFTDTWSGYIDVRETEALREVIPIVGEEFVVIRFASIQPLSGVQDNILQFVGRITKLGSLREGNPIQRRYRLYFQSLTNEDNNAKRIRKVYDGSCTDIAQMLYKGAFNKDLVVVDPARYTERIIFPNWSPFKCIRYLTSIAVSNKYNDPAYVFYEDRDGHHLTTLSQLMDKPKIDTIKIKLIQNPDDENIDKTLTSVIKVDQLFDINDNIANGLYGGTVITYDKVYKRFTEVKTTYTDTYGEFVHVAKEKLTDIRAESPKNRMQFIMQNELNSPGVYSNAKDWALKGPIRRAQLRGHKVHLYLNRSTDFKLGDILEWDLPTVQENVEAPDKILSGNWLITRIHHKFNLVNYNAHVELVKDGRG